MKLIIGLAAGALLMIGGVALASQKLGQPLGDRAPEETYAKTCGYCHGRNVGPVIRGRALPVGAIKAIVRSGRNGMPAFRPTEVTNAELDTLATWISASQADPKEKGQ
jgi:mono/diheme cytochrome c family protein